ncbi:MAG: enoyl-CoA hydratase, partial [Polaribacter sp.]|nr:enoyl-CoA hydratase [Polaribacter sp.]
MEPLVSYQSEESYAIIAIKNGKANAISHQVIEG